METDAEVAEITDALPINVTDALPTDGTDALPIDGTDALPFFVPDEWVVFAVGARVSFIIDGDILRWLTGTFWGGRRWGVCGVDCHQSGGLTADGRGCGRVLSDGYLCCPVAVVSE